MRHSFKVIMVAVLVAGACRESLIDARPEPGIRFTAGVGSTDTIQATPVQALNVRVNEADGKPARGAVVRFEAVLSAVSSLPSMTVGTLASAPLMETAVDTTDASGVASILVRFGIIAGPGKITVTVPALGFQDTARYTVTPGAAVRTHVTPRDTAVYLDGSVTLHAMVIDRIGNWRLEVPTLSSPEGVSVLGHTVRSSSFGRHVVRAAFPGITGDSVYVTVLPRGRLAAVRGYMGNTLVMMDLDGSNRVAVPLRGPISGIDWAPDGRVVAGVANSIGSANVLEAVSPAGQSSTFLSGSLATEGEDYPVFSADGRSVFFGGHANNRQTTLWRANSNGTESQSSSLSLRFDWGFSYGPSPDGTKLVHSGFLYDLQTRTVTWLDTPAESWRWSPLGDLIAYNSFSLLGVIRPDGTGRRVLSSTYTGSTDRSVDWSGDGKYLVIRSGTALELFEVASGKRAMLPFTTDFTQAVLK